MSLPKEQLLEMVNHVGEMADCFDQMIELTSMMKVFCHDPSIRKMLLIMIVLNDNSRMDKLKNMPEPTLYFQKELAKNVTSSVQAALMFSDFSNGLVTSNTETFVNGMKLCMKRM